MHIRATRWVAGHRSVEYKMAFGRALSILTCKPTVCTYRKQVSNIVWNNLERHGATLRNLTIIRCHNVASSYSPIQQLCVPSREYQKEATECEHKDIFLSSLRSGHGLLHMSRSFSCSPSVCTTNFKDVALTSFRQFSTTKSEFAKLLPTKSLLDNVKRNVGRGNCYYDVNDSSISLSHAKKKLTDRTRLIIKGRVARLKTSFSKQNLKLKDKFKAQQIKSALAVGRLKRNFEVKREDVRTIPNLLTTMRMASAPALAYLVVNEFYGVACSIFVLAGITDVLDGYIARNFKNQRTALGTVLDPLADKLLVSFLTISLTSAGLIPVPMTILILTRDVGLIAATFYIRYISLAPPRTLARYFDVSHVTAKIYPSNISKLNTVLQLSYVATSLASPVLDFVGHPLVQGLMYVTAATTFMSGADYVLTWRRRLKIVKNK